MAKKQKKSSTDSLSALISQMQGELPDISDTNYLEIEGGAGNVETINKRIEGDIEENDRQETLRAQNAKEMADRRFTEYRQLSGLVSDAKKVHDWWKKEREAGLLHDSIRDNKTRRIEEIEKSGEKISPETYNETIEQGGAVLWNTDMDPDEGLIVSEALWNSQVSEPKGDAKDIARQRKALGENVWIDRDIRHITLKKSKYEILGDSEAEKLDYLNQIFPTYINKAMTNKVRLDVPELGLMPREMSYLDAVDSKAAEDAKWAPHLRRFMLTSFYAEHGLDELNRRFVSTQVMPQLMQQLNQIDNKILNQNISETLENNKTARKIDFLNDVKIYGIQAAAGNHGYVWFNELQPDYTLNNTAGWDITIDALEWGLQEGYIDPDVVTGLPDQKFRLRDGSTTTLKKYKNGIYADRLLSIAADATTKEARQELQLRESAVRSSIATGWDTLSEGGNVPTEPQLTKLIADTAQEHGISMEHPWLNDAKNLATRADYRHMEAVKALSRQYEDKNRLLSSNLINALDPDSEDYRRWKRRGEVRGTTGLTDKEVEAALTANGAYGLLRKQEGWMGPGTGGERYDVVEYRMKDDFHVLYNAAFYANTSNDSDAVKKAEAARKAALAVKEKIEKKEYDYPVGPLKSSKEDQNEVRVYNAHLVKIKELGDGATISPDYISVQEEAAIVQAIKNPEKALPRYFRSYARFHRNGDGSKMNAQEFFEARLKATAGQRDGGDKTYSIPPDPASTNLDPKGKEQLTVNPNNATTAQFIVEPKNIEWMLGALTHPLAANGYDTAINTLGPEQTLPDNGKTISQYTVREVLELEDQSKYRYLAFGNFGLTYKNIDQLMDKAGVSMDDPFNEETQNKLLIERVKQLGNLSGFGQSWDDSYRNILPGLDKDEFKQLNQIINGQIEGKPWLQSFYTSPYNQPSVLQSTVAKAMLEDLMFA